MEVGCAPTGPAPPRAPSAVRCKLVRRSLLALAIAAAALLAMATPGRAATVQASTFELPRGASFTSVDYAGQPGERNRLQVAASGLDVFVIDPVGVMPGAGCRRPTATDPRVAVCRTVGSASLRAALRDQDDTFTSTLPAGSAVDGAEVDGGDGNDVLQGGSELDTLTGGPGSDLVFGGPLHDTIREGGRASGSDLLVGGGGVDTVSYADRRLDVRALADGARNDGEAAEGDFISGDIEELEGGAGNDVLSLSGATNLFLAERPAALVGGGGDDSLVGNRGRDILAGGRGDDRLSGRGGRDRLAGDAGNDRLSGGGGSDRLVDRSGIDRFLAGAGNDRIDSTDLSRRGRRRRDRVSCGPQRDRARVDRRDRVSRDCERARRR